MKLISFLVCIAISITSIAQTKNGKISGVVTDETQKPIDGATISLLRSKDAVLVKVAVSNKQGIYEFEKIADGEYTIAVTVAGYQKKSSKPFAKSQENYLFQKISENLPTQIVLYPLIATKLSASHLLWLT